MIQQATIIAYHEITTMSIKKIGICGSNYSCRQTAHYNSPYFFLAILRTASTCVLVQYNCPWPLFAAKSPPIKEDDRAASEICCTCDMPCLLQLSSARSSVTAILQKLVTANKVAPLAVGNRSLAMNNRRLHLVWLERRPLLHFLW